MLAAETLADLLAEEPDAVAPRARFGFAPPTSVADLPRLSLSVRSHGGGRRASDPLGPWLGGEIELVAWAASAAAAASLAGRIHAALGPRRQHLRERGFASLRTVSLGPASDERLEPPSGSSFGVGRVAVVLAFAFQAPPVEEVTEGGPITLVAVRLDPPDGERFTVA